MGELSKTDLVNSGSYFFTDLVVIFGSTIFTGLGGSFFTIGFIAGFTDTNDLTGICFLAGGSFTPGFTVCAGLLKGFEIVCTGFLATGFAVAFFITGLLEADFFAGGFLTTAFLGLVFLEAGLGFPLFDLAGFAAGFLVAFLAGLVAFLEAGF